MEKQRNLAPADGASANHAAGKSALSSGALKRDPGIGEIAIEPQKDGQALDVAVFRPLAGLAEHYESLRAAVWTCAGDAALRTLLFVSPSSGCGASTTASNYAAMLSREPGTKVLLIDARLRGHPSGKRAGATRGVSLMGLLSGSPCPVYPVPGPTNLYVLPSGAESGMPLSLFQSPAFDRFLQVVRERFQYVILDAPPIQQHPETLVFARKADGVILVVESRKTRRQTALWAKCRIEEAGGHVLGIVLNRHRRHIPGILYRWFFE
jgi:capsular exopolysaccharide synthesis family protein